LTGRFFKLERARIGRAFDRDHASTTRQEETAYMSHSAPRIRFAWLVATFSLLAVLLYPSGSHGAADDQLSTIVLTLGGDVMLARDVRQAIRDRGAEYIWGDALNWLVTADATLVNLECVIATHGTPFHPPRVFYFRADPAGLEALRVAGVDAVSLANNHSMDFSAEGLMDTTRHLQDAGIVFAGAGENREQAVRPVVFQAGSLKIGLVAFADHYAEYAATAEQPGINYVDLRKPDDGLQRIGAAIATARNQGADLVIISAHWGPNFTRRPEAHIRAFAHALVDLGADLIHGHSAHIFQGIEFYRGRPIFYGLGELIDDYYVDPRFHNDQQLLAQVSVSAQGIESIMLVPLLIANKQVNVTHGNIADDIHLRMRDLSAEYGTHIDKLPDGRLQVRLPDN
jgi:hypothetical protein